MPFIQANSFERVISLLENMKDNPMTKEQIAKKEAEARRASEQIRKKIFDRFEITMRILEEKERQRICNKIDAMMCIAAKQ